MTRIDCEVVMSSMPRRLGGNRACIMPGLPTHLVQELNVDTVCVKHSSTRTTTSRLTCSSDPEKQCCGSFCYDGAGVNGKKNNPMFFWETTEIFKKEFLLSSKNSRFFFCRSHLHHRILQCTREENCRSVKPFVQLRKGQR